MSYIKLPAFFSCSWTLPDYLKRTENFVMDRKQVLELNEIFNRLMDAWELSHDVAALQKLNAKDCKLFLDDFHNEIANCSEIDGVALLKELEICGFKTVSFYH